MHTKEGPVTEKARAWRQAKAQIIARYGTLKACARDVGCAPQSLRLAVMSELAPHVRERLLAALASRP
jgi:hypothetical protein